MRNVVGLVIDTCVVLIAVGCTVWSITGVWGIEFFKFYTTLSNLLAAVACALSIPYDVRALKAARAAGGNSPVALPKWLRLVRLAGCSTVMVTFLTVFLILGFAVGHWRLLQGSNFFFHLVSPLLVVAASTAMRSSAGLPMRAFALSVILTAAYAALYFVQVLVIGPDAGGWHDFYGFNTGGMWPVSLVAILAVSALAGCFCWWLTREKRA